MWIKIISIQLWSNLVEKKNTDKHTTKAISYNDIDKKSYKESE